ncbi:conserved hypothetical protein [Coccidioides posadasii str. Silveira]|uniref:Uncharacterized protein n=1 Tax=Coccidioides posadasii (strain RMSCC 757 / Silveira) TaxID=443226 RepID=E9D0X4_COCPS|nr:conserved hypothetical protein [Coccidioides posadasii str. Silveira]
MAEKDDRPKATGCSMASCATIDDDKAPLSSSQATCESGGCRRNMPFNTIPRITYHQMENAAPLRKPESGGAQSCPDPYDFITANDISLDQSKIFPPAPAGTIGAGENPL